ncbi:mitochondrial genome maintenance exonuclease 1 [Eublepharis macularius]|uniref:Mitochondrial genome maintenance exonuclease 1 n=1 Tax=Eublepharis macularius TaxID=481883 RepID=A0AA97JPD4_EUBMA|nr:mitochondrial genome maintenance exonuclease 1 [Eublepharis macularius]
MRPPWLPLWASGERGRLSAAGAGRRLAAGRAGGEDGRAAQERFEAAARRLAAFRRGPPLANPAKAAAPARGPPAPSKAPAPAPLRVGLRRGAAASVTAVLGRTRPPEQAWALERWRQRQVRELGPEGFAALTEQTFQQGKLFHAALEMLLLAEESPVKQQEEPSGVSGYLASVQHVLREVSGVRALESAVQHETLHYQGLVDCVAEYRGRLCVIDWKTSGKSKPLLRNTFDNPLQVVAYVGALNHDANYDFQVDCGLLVVAYKDGSPAHPHYMDPELCSHYWNKWLLRLKEFREKEGLRDDSRSEMDLGLV